MTETKPSSRSDQTRETLILAALQVFGRYGFDGASTRAIAKAAGVNLALIGYHFGGKRGLYLAVFEHIGRQMQQRMVPVADEVMRRLEAVPEDEVARRELAVQLMLTIFDGFTGMFGEQASAGGVRLILREQQDPTEAFQLLYDASLSRMLALFTQLVTMASGLEATSEACRARTLMILGQVLVFYVARGTTSKYLAWESISPDNIAVIKKQFRFVLESQFSQGVARS